MPYNKISELPKGVRNNLPNDAQKIFLETFNNAHKTYRDPEKRRGSDSADDAARKVAWSAVKKKYKKEGENWVEKS